MIIIDISKAEAAYIRKNAKDIPIVVLNQHAPARKHGHMVQNDARVRALLMQHRKNHMRVIERG